MQRITKFFLLLFLTVSITAQSQLNGTYSLPGSFANLAAAINTLNSLGVTGPVTINIAAGYIETAPSGGYQLNQINGSGAANTITFKKSGVGVNPLITAYSGGSGIPSSPTNQDGIWRFVGTDYVTVDGIDLLDPNTSNPATMEFGYGFFKANNSNGCIYNTIRNCTITLNRVNAAAGGGSSPGGSKGIYMIAAAPPSITLAIGGNVIQASNSYNRFYSNKIQNCQKGISIIGYEGQGFVPYCDLNNDVGGALAATGNTVVNFGGSPGNSESIGIEATYQYSFNVSYNKINNNDGAGFDPANFLTAIRTSYYTSADLTINSNSINLSASPGNTLAMNGINNLTSYSVSLNPPGIININNNIFSSYSSGSVTSTGPGQRALIYSSGYTSRTNINSNLIQNVSSGNLSGLIYSDRAYTCTINSNTITNVSYENTLSGITSNAYSLTITGNYINNISSVNAPPYPGFVSIGGGDFSNIMTISNNTVSNVSVNGFCGVCFGSNASFNPQYTVTANDINNISSVPGTTSGVFFTGISVNDVSTSSSNAVINGNKIYSFSSVGAVSYTNFGNSSYLRGILLNNIDYVDVSRNKIHSFYSDRFAGNLIGLGYSGGSSVCSSCFTSLYNNLIGNFEMTNSDGFIAGISLGERNHTISFNTINFSSQNTGSNTISSAIYFSAPQSGTPRAINVVNNILVNQLQATGTGTAQLLLLTTPLNYLGNLSNRNIYSAGTPAPNRLIAKINGVAYQTITAFKATVAPRETQTFTENPVFSSTVGLSANYLDLDPTVITLAENGATPTLGITTDFAGTIRNSNNPDIGAWEGNFVGYDRVAPFIVSSGFTTLPCGNFTTRTFTLALMDTSGVASGGLSPRLYYKVNSGSYTSVQGVLSSGTSTNGVWTFNLAYSTVAGATISYYFAAQDQSTFNNLFILPSAGAVANSVNPIQTPPPFPFTYVLQNYPTITVANGSLCAGQSYNLYANGVSTYTFSGGSSVVSPTISTSYSVTGSSSSGCPATNTAVINLTVFTPPTVSVNSGSICLGNSFLITPAGAATYTVQGGAVFVSPASTTNYTVVGKSSSGCLSTNTAICSVTVNPLPNVTTSSSHSIVCAGETVTLTASGASGYTFNPGGAGPTSIVSPSVTYTYGVTGVSDKGCESVVFITQIVSACTGLQTLNGLNSEISIYPNPTPGILHLESEADYDVIILNVIGEIVYSSQLPSGHHQIDLVDLANGIYFVKLVNASNSKSFKIIKE